MNELREIRESVLERSRRLYDDFDAPDRLRSHLETVEAAAFKIVTDMTEEFDSLDLDVEAVLFGAATHDIGKVRHPEELEASGSLHEEAGEQLLRDAGVSERLARFARTHGSIDEESTLDDILVALSDNLWKGKRDEALEARVLEEICDRTSRQRWEVFAVLDSIAREVFVGVESTT